MTSMVLAPESSLLVFWMSNGNLFDVVDVLFVCLFVISWTNDWLLGRNFMNCSEGCKTVSVHAILACEKMSTVTLNYPRYLLEVCFPFVSQMVLYYLIVQVSAGIYEMVLKWKFLM